ncbi:MAG: hypothetical protein JSU73_08365 [candidate division WOR-3 bacterium]|nr:MAG: hypothetical protein JSU73_08365 [candidate division WOR-3 bacterium]
MILVAWIGVMGLLAAGAGWVILSRFPEVFFQSDDWRCSRRGRISRAVIVGLLVFFSLVALAGITMLVLLRVRAE